MLVEKGHVKVVEGDEIIVTTQVKSTCASCAAKDSCGSGLVARAFTAKTLEHQFTSSDPYHVGDTVHLQVDEGALLSASFWIYIMPILGLLIGAVGFSWLNTMIIHHELLVIFGSLLTTCMSFLLAKKSVTNSPSRYHPKLVDPPIR
jgi:sigma-E factor negative regulatory protein RseC